MKSLFELLNNDIVRQAAVHIGVAEMRDRMYNHRRDSSDVQGFLGTAGGSQRTLLAEIDRVLFLLNKMNESSELRERAAAEALFQEMRVARERGVDKEKDLAAFLVSQVGQARMNAPSDESSEQSEVDALCSISELSEDDLASQVAFAHQGPVAVNLAKLLRALSVADERIGDFGSQYDDKLEELRRGQTRSARQARKAQRRPFGERVRRLFH